MPQKNIQKKKIKIINRPPRFYWLIRFFSPSYDFKKVLAFAFGNLIFTHLDPIPDHILLHEKVHLRQMRYSRFWGAIHFIRFVLSDKFKYKTELEAYKAEYEYIKRIAPNYSLEAAKRYAEVLSGQGKNAYIYGRLKSYEEALTDIIL